MISFIDLDTSEPYQRFLSAYSKAIKHNQEDIEVMSVSSYSNSLNEVNSRYVNLKFVEGKNLIFFSNYKSSKAVDFKEHNQITALFYWNKINTQIRIKGLISKTSKDYNQKYFYKREKNKNALAISSNQSQVIKSYQAVHDKYNNVLNQDKLDECPEYWGGYSIKPFYLEFWQGHESRINKREVFNLKGNIWKKFFLEP